MKKLNKLLLIAGTCLSIAFMLTSCDKAANNTVAPQVVDSLKTGLIAYYPFDNSGADLSGNGNDGFVYNITSTSDHNGKPNAAYHFDGTTSYILVKDNAALRLNNTDYTINCWEKQESYGATFGSVIACKRGAGNNNGWSYGVHGYTYNGGATVGQTTMQISGGTDIAAIGATSLNLNTWYMLTTVYNVKKQQISYYINGVLDNVANNIPSPVLTATSDMYIGTDNPATGTSGYFFKGSLDDMSMFNRALTATEIKKIYNLTSSAL